MVSSNWEAAAVKWSLQLSFLFMDKFPESEILASPPNYGYSYFMGKK